MTESIEDVLVEVSEPKRNRGISNKQLLIGKPVSPIDRLKTISEDEFEELIEEWVYGYLLPKYKNTQQIDKVVRLAGSGDKGRDVVAYVKYSKDGEDIWDNYQCKHYNSKLKPSEMWIEFGKVCYYTYKGDYSKPRKYYFVSPHGVGSKLFDLLSNPVKLRDELIRNWDTHCLDKISNEKVQLSGEFKEYVKKFDFSIFDSINPGELIDQYQQTMYFPFRFGGGLTKEPVRLSEPEDVASIEQTYVKKLYKAYSDYKKEEIVNLLQLRSYNNLFSHFQRQRTYFYQAESLKVFERDSIPPGIDAFEDLKEEVYHGVIDTVYDEYKDGYARVKATTDMAKSLSLAPGNILTDFVTVKDKMGICHHLANEKNNESDVRWAMDDGI